jgi:hypothetical protein
LIIRQRGSELLHIGRSRRYDRTSAAAILARLATERGRIGEMRMCLASIMPAGQVASLDNRAVLETLATKIARNEVAFIWLRPQDANAPEIVAEDQPPVAPAPVKEEPKEEQHWIEIELLSEEAPNEPVAGAKYIIELPDKSIIEGYLDKKGKARIEGVKPGECKVTFPEYADPKNDGDVEIEEPPVALPPPKEDCAITKIEVECEHNAKRKKKITLPSNDKSPVILEVVGAARGSGDKIKTTLTYVNPACDDHTNQQLVIKSPTGGLIQFAENEGTFEAYYDDPSEMSVVRMWPWDESPDDFKIIPHACRIVPKQAVIVRVFPAYEPSLSFKFSLDTEDRVGAKMKAAKAKGKVEKRGRPPQTDWKIEFQAKLKYGKRVRTLTAEYEGKLRQMASVNLVIKRVIDKFTDLFYKWCGIAVYPEFPSLELSYEGKFKEIENSFRVGTEYNLTFKADPLFGITFKIDILKVLISALRPLAPPVAEFLDKALEWAKENEQTLELTISFSGLIGGEIGVEKKAENQKPGFKGLLQGKLKVAFAAKAEASAKFLVSFAFGAEVGADTGIAAKLLMDHDDKGLYLKGAVTRLECKFKWSAWASGKFIWEVKEAYEDEYTWWEEKDLWESDNAYVMRRDH